MLDGNFVCSLCSSLNIESGFGLKKNMKKDDHGRVHLRTRMRTRLKMAHNEFGELVVFSGNISDGGVFIELVATEKPEAGDIVSVQIQDLPIEAPVIKARVARVTDYGIGLEFIDQS